MKIILATAFSVAVVWAAVISPFRTSDVRVSSVPAVPVGIVSENRATAEESTETVVETYVKSVPSGIPQTFGNGKTGLDRLVELAYEDRPRIVGCVHTKTHEIRLPNSDGNCFVGPGYQNVTIPKKGDFAVFRKMWGSDLSVMLILPIPAMESSFREEAAFVRNGEPYAIGYVQTLAKWKIPTDAESQLKWVAERVDWQIAKPSLCMGKSTFDDLARCVYARHHGDASDYADYPRKLLKIHHFYRQLSENAVSLRE